MDTRRLTRVVMLSAAINHIRIALAGAKRSTGHKLDISRWRGSVTQPRAADDFATIRARMEELRRERAGEQATENELPRDHPLQRSRSLRWPLPEIGAGSGRVRQSGSGRG